MSDVKDARDRPAVEPARDQDRPPWDEATPPGTSGLLAGMSGDGWVYAAVAAVALAIGFVGALSTADDIFRRGGAYDLAILDIGMPGLDGHQVASALRAIPACERTYLAALTGWGAADDRARSRRAGFNTHLTKPAGIAEIRQLMQALKGAVLAEDRVEAAPSMSTG